MTETTVTTPSPDAIRASFHIAHQALTSAAKSDDFEGLSQWSQATADYLGKLHDQMSSLQTVVASQAVTIATLQNQMAAVLDGVAELGGDAPALTPASSPTAEVETPSPIVVADPEPAVAADPAPVEAAPVEAAPVEAAPAVAAVAEPAAVEPAASAEVAPADATPAI